MTSPIRTGARIRILETFSIEILAYFDVFLLRNIFRRLLCKKIDPKAITSLKPTMRNSVHNRTNWPQWLKFVCFACLPQIPRTILGVAVFVHCWLNSHTRMLTTTRICCMVHFCLFSWHSGLVSLWPFSFVGGGQKCWLMCWQCIRLAIGVYGHSHRSWWSHTWTPLTSRPYPCDKVRCPILGEPKSSATNSQVSRFLIETHRWMQKVSSLILQKRFRKSMANWASYAQKSKFTRTPVRIVG